MQILAQSLQSALAPLTTQEFIDDLIIGVQALAEHLYTDHELELINILDGQMPDISMVQQAHDCVYNHLISVCQLHRLRVDEASHVRVLAKLVRALLIMQQWDDPATILAVCSSDASDEERLANLVGIVGELTETEALSVILEIDVNFLRGLQRLYSSDAISTDDPSELQVSEEQLTKLRQWRNLMGAQRGLAYRMMKAGYRPGAALEQYTRRVSSALLERDNKDIAAELIPFILMSRDGWQAPLMAWRDLSKTLDLQPQDITAVDVEVIKLLGEFDRLKTQGVNP